MKKKNTKLIVVHIRPIGRDTMLCGIGFTYISGGAVCRVPASYWWDPDWDKRYRKCLRCWNSPKLPLLSLGSTNL